MGAHNAGINYHLYNSIILNNKINIYIINDWLRFVNKPRLSNDFIYTRTGLDLIKGIKTTVITI